PGGKDEMFDPGRQQGQASPAQQGAYEYAPRPDAVAQKACRDLKERIAQQKGGEDATHLRLIDSELAHEVVADHSDVDPLDIADRADGTQHGDDRPAVRN